MTMLLNELKFSKRLHWKGNQIPRNMLGGLQTSKITFNYSVREEDDNSPLTRWIYED